MIEHCHRAPSSAIAAKPRIFSGTRFLSVFILLTLLAGSVGARVEEAEDQYLRIFGLIERADALSQRGENDSARTNYIQAQTQLLNLKRSNPTWNAKLVTFRLEYLAGRIAAMAREDNATAPVSTAATAGAKTVAAASGQVKLLEAGAEPRKPLRISPKPGDKQVLSFTMKISMGMDMAGAPAEPVKMPTLQLTLDTAVKDVSADGDITYELVVADASMADEPGITPQLAEAMKPSINSLKGFSSTGVTSNRGLHKGIELKPGAGADPQARQHMAQLNEALANLLPPFPEEPVGQGAKWEAKTKLKSQGMAIDQTSTYKLNSIEDARLSLGSSVVQNAANQKIQSPMMPGLKVDVVKLTGSGAGDLTLDLTQLLPVKARMNAKSETVMGMTIGGQKQTMTMRMENEFQLESK